MVRPSGTVTFVFTDIQGSTQLWEHQRGAMEYAFQRQEEIIRGAMNFHGGYVYKMIGDAFQVAFATAKDALQAALNAQQNLHTENWDEKIAEIKVRMALHTGVTEERGDDYLGPVLNRAARLLSAGHGGQVLLSEAVYQLVREDLPAGCQLQFLGEYRLKDLIQPENVYQATAPGMVDYFPPLKAESVQNRRFPFHSQPFIGRKEELARISEILGDPTCRIVSLLGIGGCGKTRLAVRATEESSGFNDGVCFCGLENVETELGLILAIAEGVNLTINTPPGISITAGTARGQLFQYLASKQLLLVLDNFEQLVFCADLVGDLLNTASKVKVIATSRQRLNLPGEWVMEIEGLAFPTEESYEALQEFSAVQLFVNTAERNSDMHPGPEDWHSILRICQMLEGIPLALEMAAGWTRTLSCAEIAEEISRDQDILSASWVGVPKRHQTLRAVFDHSWRLLDDAEQVVFIRLSIFLGGFTREGAQVVADARLPIIRHFIDKALIRRISSGRFEIHPLLRRYAAEKISENPVLLTETHSRMADYYIEWLTLMNEKLKGEDHLTGLFAIRGEISNLHQSFEWLVQKVDVERLSKVLPAWILFHVMNDRKFEMLEAARSMVELVNNLRPRVSRLESTDAVLLSLADAAVRYFYNNESTEILIEPYHTESMRLIHGIPDHVNKAYALLLNCIGPSFLTPIETIECAHQCILLFDHYQDPWGCAMGYLILGDVNTFAILIPDDARAAYTRSLQNFTLLGSSWGRALCSSGLMYLERKLENLEESYRFGTTCLEIFDEMGSYERMIPIRQNLAEITEKLGRTQEASRYYQSNLAHFTLRGAETEKLYYRNKLAELAFKSDP